MMEEQNDQSDEMVDLRRMLAELNRPASPLRTTTTTTEANDARQMLAGFATLSAPDLSEPTVSAGEDAEDEENEENIGILPVRLQNQQAHLDSMQTVLDYVGTSTASGQDAEEEVREPFTTHLEQ